MQRRSFLKAAAAFVGGVAIEQAIPFGRVWSFPSERLTLGGQRIFPMYGGTGGFPIGHVEYFKDGGLWSPKPTWYGEKRFPLQALPSAPSISELARRCSESHSQLVSHWMGAALVSIANIRLVSGRKAAADFDRT